MVRSVRNNRRFDINYEILQLYHTILNLNYHQMRRFITLIDALYEESVQVVVLAEAIPTKLLKLTAKERKSPHDEVRTV